MSIEKFSQQTNQSADDESKIQERREERYKKAVEVEHNFESIEPIDIFQTPLLFRQDDSPLAYLEFEKRGAIVPPEETSKTTTIQRRRTSNKNSQPVPNSIYLEAPIPFAYQSALDEIKKIFPEVDVEKLVSLFKRTSKIHLAEKGKGSDENYQTESQEILTEWLNDPTLKKVWLWIQESFIKKGNGPLGQATFSERIGQFTRKGSFLVSPKNIDKLSVATGQTHHDYAFEVLHLGRISRDEIVGFLVPDKDTLRVKTKEGDKGDLQMSSYDHFFKTLKQRNREDPDYIGFKNTRGKQEAKGMLSGAFGNLDNPSEKQMERWKDLFPYEDINWSDPVETISNGLIRYVKDRFGVDPRKIKTDNLILLIVKKMGIPIYDFQGNLVWPEEKTHEEIEKEMREKEKSE